MVRRTPNYESARRKEDAGLKPSSLSAAIVGRESQQKTFESTNVVSKHNPKWLENYCHAKNGAFDLDLLILECNELYTHMLIIAELRRNHRCCTMYIAVVVI